MVLIAHLSDPHLAPLPPVTAGDLLSKRAFGFLNWRGNRNHVYDSAVLDALLADMRASAPDLIAVTGDLANLGLAAEFDHGREWLAALGAPEAVTVVPGNHDAYVPGAFAILNRAWRPFMAGDERDKADFPFVRRRGPLTLIGLSTAVATPPLMATGTLGPAQTAALGEVLAATGLEGLARVVLIHHDPVAGSTPWHRRLTDAARFRDVIARHGAELVLHGHNHRFSVASVPGDARPVPVVGAAAASLVPREHRAGGSYNLLRIEGKDGTATIDLTRRQFTGNGAVKTTHEQRIAG